jgi:flagellar biosynthesis/type III secretory pathway M-ring protein FliF/YscJ
MPKNRKWVALLIGLIIVLATGAVNFIFFANNADSVKGQRSFVVYKSNLSASEFSRYNRCLENTNVEHISSKSGQVEIRQIDVNRASISCP